MACQNEADIPPSLTCLKSFDTLLRCPICFDFVSIAMMTKCSHNFCSLCIRKFLSFKSQCPVCNSSTTEQDLRNNRILDELVISFQSTRQELSKISFDSPPLSPATPTSAVTCSTPTPRARARGPVRDGSIVSHFFKRAPGASPPAVAATTPVSRTSARFRGSPKARPRPADASPRVAVKEEPQEDAVGCEVMEKTACSSSVAEAAAVTSAATSSSPSTSSLAAVEDAKPVIKVECPVCSVGISQLMINKHLDSCLTRGEKKESLRSSPSDVRRPMGKLVYNLLSLVDLRRRLRDCHLSTQGPRDKLVRRHQAFVHAYNAQCDSLQPKSAEEIAKEVEANEKIRDQLQGKAKPVLVFSKNQSEVEIDAIHSNYRKQHSSAFSRLVAQVKGHMKARVKQEVVPEEEVAEGSQCTDAGSKAPTEGGEGLSVMLLEPTSEELHSAAKDVAPLSPTQSEVSISSSLSDIIGEDPKAPVACSERTPGRKRRAAFLGNDGSPPPQVLGKRRRKT